MDFGCDQIKCISLKERTDKQEYVHNLLSKLKINFSFFPAIKDKKMPSRGCFRSHFKIISDAYKQGCQRIMIFEDDIQLSKEVDKHTINKITRFLDTTKDWEIFFLGGSPNTWSSNLKKINHYNNIYKGNFIATHAYIINRKGMEKYKDVQWGKPYTLIDVQVYNNNQHSYAYLPEMYSQRTIKNDIGNNSKFFLTLRQKFGAKLNEWYALNINIQIKKVLLIITILILLKIITKKIKI